MAWTCDGVAKDGKQYPDRGGQHPEYQNDGPDCLMCGLPREAMQPGKPGKSSGGTTVSGAKPGSFPLVPIIIAIAVLLVGGAGGFALYKLMGGNNSSQNGQVSPSPSPTTPVSADSFVSDSATNKQSFSQGEKILLNQSPDKTTGASQFALRNWDGAIAAYQQATSQDSNDPEGKIYLNNAQARKVGNPLTVAVAVPIAASTNSAKEILRGVAQAQEEFNKSGSARQLEVVIFDYGDALQAVSIAEDIVKASNVLGVLGYGVDPASNQALRVYESAGISVLSPLTVSVNQSTLQTISLGQKANELLGNYLQAAAKTLAEYASQKQSSPSVVLFFNSDSPYSMQLKDELTKAVTAVKGKVVKAVDTAVGGFAAQAEVTSAKNSGAKVAIFALSKNKVDRAIAIAQANQNTGSSLVLLGGDELYNPEILIDGKKAIEGIVLAVPWSFQPGDTFAEQAKQSWQGRISWRTATAYDASQILAKAVSQNPSRSGLSQRLSQGVPLGGNATNFQAFQEVPLVKAVPGTSGPPGSQYQFDPIL
jgi:ABC-type branched-subunit amino acid transport system substrate-binding protein